MSSSSRSSLDGSRGETIDWPQTKGAYQLVTISGYGSNPHSTNWLGRCLANGEAVSIRRIDLDLVSDKFLQTPNYILGTKHPNVLPQYVSFIEESELWIVSKQSEGSVEDFLASVAPNGLPETIIVPVLTQVLIALDYLHSNNFIHRDIRAKHIHIDTDGTVMITYLSKMKALMQKGRKVQAHTLNVGALHWCAPEALHNPSRDPGEASAGYNSSADIWSFGITALEMAQGSPPHAHAPSEIFASLSTNFAPPTLRDNIAKEFSSNFKEVIESCLVVQADKRPTAKDLLSRAIFKKQIKKSKEKIAAWIKDLERKGLNYERRLEIAKKKLANFHDHTDSDSDSANASKPIDVPTKTSAASSSSISSSSLTSISSTTIGDDMASNSSPSNNPNNATNPNNLSRSTPSSGDQDWILDDPPAQTSSNQRELMVVEQTPIETQLGETAEEYYVFIRTLPSTTLHFKVRGNALVITGILPDMPTLPNVQLISISSKQFEYEIELPEPIDPTQTSKELLKKTLIIRLTKKNPSTSIGSIVM
eukprot:CAMPEP_0201546458 /NCGR_PEP_ID=MMETSP0173_2-20130828/2712_1 /ASSEMBLY_ACC=CAM_ASM_000268 /TAXON_ID=218659 /ORGANISM="Vexillifera sp., Strain DIVA3 564/2" /LENGTH=534 /DNA_ID=CAMNT_0047955107 /DNA_START=28 /DNA_END=1632 /DNA_ORIENTATION=-